MLAEIGYALSALGNLFFLLLLLTVRKSGLPKRLLIISCATSLVLSLLYASLAWFPLAIPQLLIAESLIAIAWLLFIASWLKDSQLPFVALLRQPLNLMIVILPLVALGVALYSSYAQPLQWNWQYLLQTIINLEILVLLETFYRQASEQKWAYKPMVIALGGEALFNFVMYSEAAMIGQIDPMLWSARGYIYAAMIPFMVIALRRIKHWGIDIFVSRDVVLHSSLLVVAGIYLFVMALAGYAIRLIGGNWSYVIQVVFIFLSLTLMAALFLSNQFRTKIKVFITKHFFANQFDYREEWLKLTHQLEDNDQSDRQDFYYTALKSLLGAINGQSGLLLRLRDGQWQSLAEVEHDELSELDNELLQQLLPFVEKTEWIIDIEQLRSRPFDYEGLKVNHALLNGCSFHLLLPIVNQQGLWGLGLIQDKHGHRHPLNWELRDYLKVVTTQVASYIFQHEASSELAENAQFAAFSRMSAFVLHDLKNVMAQIDLILCNAQQHKHNPEFIEDTFETLEHTKARMERMLRQLTDKKDISGEHIQQCDVGALLNEVITRRCQTLQPIPQLTCQAQVSVALDAEKLSNVLYHLINNAQQATADDGWVKVTLAKIDEQQKFSVSIADNGSGMSAEFIQQRLFKPFDTTKGNAGMGIGAYDAKNYIEKLGGQIDINSEPGRGTVFRIILPLNME